jgi:cytochrome P450
MRSFAENSSSPAAPLVPEGENLKPISELPIFRPPGEIDCAKAFKIDPPMVFVDAYKKLGPIFRCRFVGRDVVAMGGLEANELIWGHNELWDYHLTNAHFREQFDESYLNQLEGEAFYKKRRRTAQGFKPSVLMAQTASMSKALYQEIDDVISGPIEMRLFCMRLIICMTSRVLMQTDLPKGMDRTMAISNRDMLRAPSLGKWRHLFYWKPARIWRRRKIFSFLGRLIDLRAKSPVPKEDILSVILAAHPATEPPIPRQELIYDLSQLFMAGSTTTSQVILWTLIYLMKDPAWLAELREELKDWDPFNFTSMSPYPKLKATLLETERLRPPGQAITRITAQDFSFHGYLIPKGTPVLHLQTLCHYLPEIYEDPLAYRPQRFIENPSFPPKNAHGIFGGGAHACVGQPLVRILTPLLVADVITKYDVKFETPLSLRAKIDVVTTPAEKDIWGRLVPRSVPAEEAPTGQLTPA